METDTLIGVDPDADFDEPEDELELVDIADAPTVEPIEVVDHTDDDDTA